MAVRQRPSSTGVTKSANKKSSGKSTRKRVRTMSRTNGKGTHAHLPQAASANAAVVADSIDRTRKTARSMPLQAMDATRIERLAGFGPADVMNAWLAAPTAWLGAAQSVSRLASPALASEIITSLADQQLQMWQTLLRASPLTVLLKEQAKATEALVKAWQLGSSESKHRSGKTTKSGKAA